jgi:hypothetical protein
MRRLAKVAIILDLCTTNVAHKGPASATNFIATIRLNETLPTLGALPDLCSCNCFFDCQSSLAFLIFFYLVTAQRDMGSLAATSTRFILTIFYRTAENPLGWIKSSLKATFRTGANIIKAGSLNGNLELQLVIFP